MYSHEHIKKKKRKKGLINKDINNIRISIIFMQMYIHVFSDERIRRLGLPSTAGHIQATAGMGSMGTTKDSRKGATEAGD